MITADRFGGPRRRGYAVVIVLVVAAVLSFAGYLAFGSSGSGSPSSVVRSYLRALARGDAQAALSLGEAPDDRLLLNSQVLHRQQAVGPISAISVIGTDSGSYGSVVHVRYRVGSSTVVDHFEVIPDGSGWKLAHTAVDILISGADNLHLPAVFGQPLGNRDEVYAFPGVVMFGSTDPEYALTPDSVVFTNPDVATMASPKTVLSSDGTSTATSAVRTAMLACARTRSLAPPRCSQHAGRPHVTGLVANSLRWQAPTDYSGLSFRVDERTPTTVHVAGKLTWHLLYRAQPAHSKRTVPGSIAVSSQPGGTVGFDTTPPTYRAP
ncbi:MAG: hypothetical protein ACRDWT_04965 [Jatrophihabitantaceae bacterium]